MRERLPKKFFSTIVIASREQVCLFPTILLLMLVSLNLHSDVGGGGSLSYFSFVGDCGRDVTGGIYPELCGKKSFSPSESLELKIGATKLRGRENEHYALVLTSCKANLILSPLDKSYFIRYGISVFNIDRGISDHREKGVSGGFVFGLGYSILKKENFKLNLSINYFKLIGKGGSADAISLEQSIIYLH